MKTREKVTEQDIDFIVSALNAYWNEAMHNLKERKQLGDIEREMYQKQCDCSKEIMEKLGGF